MQFAVLTVFILTSALLVKADILDISLLNIGIRLAPTRAICQRPNNFPLSIELSKQTFHNWAEDILVPDLWTAFPKDANEIVDISNWAAQHGYNIRASGYMHNWSPFTVLNTDSCLETKIILVKTSKLTNMEMINDGDGNSGAVKVQAGASMENLMEFLENNGYGIYASPAPGDVSVGGVLAVGAHGGGISPLKSSPPPQGFTYGSISNLVVSFTAVVWDSNEHKFKLRTFSRSEPDSKAFLVNLGRTFLIDATLRVGRNYNLRCVSRLDIPASELFAAPSSTSPNKIQEFMDASGRFEVIWFPFTDNPWLKIWTISPLKPQSSRLVTKPYNYPITDNIPIDVSLLAGRIVEGAWFLAPAFGQLQYTTVVTGLALTNSYDIWGPSKNTLLYVRPTTLRVTANGYAIITSRANVQNVLYKVTEYYQKNLKDHQARFQYPINGPLEIRVTGLDWPEDVGVFGAEAPSLSAIRPVNGRRDLDVAIWLDILTFPGTPNTNLFMKDFESYLLGVVNDGVNAVVRPEWSKGWGYTNQAPHSNLTVIKKIIPGLYETTYPDGDFDWSVNTLNKYDPKQVFSNHWLNALVA